MNDQDRIYLHPFKVWENPIQIRKHRRVQKSMSWFEPILKFVFLYGRDWTTLSFWSEFWGFQGSHLVAPHCAIPRDYLSDTPLLRAMGFLAPQHGQLGAIPPPPSLSVSPLGEHAKWRCDTPPQKGYLSDTGVIPYENKAKACDTPLCDTISKGYCAIWGGVSHWAAKGIFHPQCMD